MNEIEKAEAEEVPRSMCTPTFEDQVCAKLDRIEDLLYRSQMSKTESGTPPLEDTSALCRADMLELVEMADALRGDREGGIEMVELGVDHVIASRSEYVAMALEIRRLRIKVDRLETEKENGR